MEKNGNFYVNPVLAQIDFFMWL
ncbi:hypothetical protein FWK35_00003145 [Aphis craccivora]|uniref:Uncharacterized protein n=1 Tax=Aphis craccivora TaxID=307492 RepID=A0A6G0ZDG2_APHCR|nr:hypothetical protein FWK35_00003145 [Aphis craccivora]